MAKETTTYVWKDRKHHLWFPLSFTSYYIEDDRLMIKSGFLNTTLDETLLYRIIDIQFKQSLAGKIFGTGNVILKTKADLSRFIRFFYRQLPSCLLYLSCKIVGVSPTT